MARTKNFQTEKKWIFLDQNKPKFKSSILSEEVVAILSNRGVTTEKEALVFLNPDYNVLHDPFLLKDMVKAVDCVMTAVEEGKKITVYGDYDVDGITSTALLLLFLKKIGVKADYYIPSRQDEGYGLNQAAIQEIAGKGTKLLITVDCGSTSAEEIGLAKSLGLKVVVTDHHALIQKDGKDILPPAEAVINPKRADSKFREELAGVGVVFYLIRAIQSKLADKFSEGQEKWFLDLVALGTICDVVPLFSDNRILTSFGLKVLAKTKLPGIKALARVSGFDIKEIDSYKVGFLLGPRLNAAGRIEHADKALRLLITEDLAEAETLAAELNELNLARQELTEKILTEARERISGLSQKQKIYLLADKNWPSGVVGIVASRLVEEFGRPVLIMEETEGELKGSARSIAGFNIVENLSKCGEFLSHFGGHAYAAGFKLKKEHFILLENRLIEIADGEIKEADLTPELTIDKRVVNKNITQGLMSELKKLEPFGSGNYPPVFASSDEEIIESRLVGKPSVHLKINLKDESGYLRGIAFNYGEAAPEIGQKVSAAFYIEENNWNNQKSIEGRFIDLKIA